MRYHAFMHNFMVVGAMGGGDRGMGSIAVVGRWWWDGWFWMHGGGVDFG